MIDRPIIIDQLIRGDDTSLAFAATDTHGRLEVWVTMPLWEELKAAAPVMSNTDDMMDYAMLEIEQRAIGLEPARKSDGVRILFVG